jgi:hypothetical protein
MWLTNLDLTVRTITTFFRAGIVAQVVEALESKPQYHLKEKVTFLKQCEKLHFML